MSEEIFDAVNERDEVIGQRPRSEVHRLGLEHRAVHVLVFNARGELFLPKRSLKKDCFPGAWDSSVRTSRGRRELRRSRRARRDAGHFESEAAQGGNFSGAGISATKRSAASMKISPVCSPRHVRET